MFSYYKHGIEDVTPERVLTYPNLLNMIRNNPKKNEIDFLRSLSYGSEEYNRKKKQLPYITPHAVCNGGRSKKHVVTPSGYLYYDIDANGISEPLMALKQRLIDEYGDYICTIGKSVGGRGLFFYVNVNGITLENFSEVHEYFAKKIFTSLTLDNHATGIARAQIIGYDNDIWFKENIIDLPIIEKLKGKDGVNTCSKDDIHRFSPTPIGEILPTLVLQTPVDTGNADCLIQPIEVVRVWIQDKIPDGRKHSVFMTYTNIIVSLNPNLSLHEMQSFINYINLHRTCGKPMKEAEMLNLVKFAYDETKRTGLWNAQWIKIKRVHVSKSRGLSRKEKIVIANKAIGKLRRSDTIKKIEVAIRVLVEEEREITVRNVYKVCSVFPQFKLSLKTIRKYLPDALGNIDSLAA